jgi:hypothetical protein
LKVVVAFHKMKPSLCDTRTNKVQLEACFQILRVSFSDSILSWQALVNTAVGDRVP